MNAGINQVLIIPEPDNDNVYGIKMAGDFDHERMWSVYGVVKALPSKLWFHPLTGNLVIDQWITDKGLEWETDMELKIGDRVLFKYNQWMEDDIQTQAGMIVRYDSIYAIVNKSIQPINGYIFVDEEGNVKHTGGLNKRYLHYPERSDGDIGTKVLYGKNRGVRMEVEEFEQIGLRRLQRKEVMLYK